MAIWFEPYTLASIDFFGAHLPSHLGIEFIELGDDYLKARMPVDERTKQPFGILHGGASVALAETVGSTAASGPARRCGNRRRDSSWTARNSVASARRSTPITCAPSRAAG